MEQRTKSWIEWRNKGVGSSDAPAIMGVSPWKTRLQLWEEKTGKKKPEATNYAQQKGVNMEDEARAHYELTHDRDMPADCVEHKEHPFLRASLDGYNRAENLVLEIKCPGAEDHATAVAGKVPEKYWPQVQHMLMITGGELDYFSYHKEKGATVRVKPDLSYIPKLFIAELEFWEMVQKKEAPPMSKDDVLEVTDPQMISLVSAYATRKALLDSLESELTTLKTAIRAKMQHPKMSCGTIRISEIERKGSVEYTKVPQLEGVDLEPYRKPSIKVFEIRI